MLWAHQINDMQHVQKEKDILLAGGSVKMLSVGFSAVIRLLEVQCNFCKCRRYATGFARSRCTDATFRLKCICVALEDTKVPAKSSLKS